MNEASRIGLDEALTGELPRRLEPHEIRTVLNQVTFGGNFRRKLGSGPLSQIGGSFHSLSSGLAYHHYRKAYRTRFGVSSPHWLEELHPDHAAQLCKTCLAENAVLPEVYPACPLT